MRVVKIDLVENSESYLYLESYLSIFKNDFCEYVSLITQQPDEYEYDVDGRKRRRGGEGPGPSEDRIKEMLWREEMLKK